MTIIKDYFDELEFWDTAFFKQPIVKKGELIIPARQVVVYKEHPLNHTDENMTLPECNLIFTNPKSSVRLVSEYLDPENYKGFKPSYIISDGSFPQINELTELFVLEGTLENPPSWVKWEIESVSFSLEV
ncbi:MAG TPA: hypothetical protein VK184_21025 [Nostocaceae cyanobacterium]|nr:hypothetical protein [Nostocaceae cyanobacterium]